MSLVGLVRRFRPKLLHTNRTYAVGYLSSRALLGLWQVSGRSNLSWQDSVRLDLYYVENWSLAGDLVIILRTIRAVFHSTGAY